MPSKWPTRAISDWEKQTTRMDCQSAHPGKGSRMGTGGSISTQKWLACMRNLWKNRSLGKDWSGTKTILIRNPILSSNLTITSRTRALPTKSYPEPHGSRPTLLTRDSKLSLPHSSTFQKLPLPSFFRQNKLTRLMRRSWRNTRKRLNDWGQWRRSASICGRNLWGIYSADIRERSSAVEVQSDSIHWCILLRYEEIIIAWFTISMMG